MVSNTNDIPIFSQSEALNNTSMLRLESEEVCHSDFGGGQLRRTLNSAVAAASRIGGCSANCLRVNKTIARFIQYFADYFIVFLYLISKLGKSFGIVPI